MSAVFGSDTNKLHNKKIQERGLFGTLLPDFGIMSVWYLFSKRGYDWILKLFDVRLPYYASIRMGLWDAFANDDTTYMYVGKNTQNDGI